MIFRTKTQQDAGKHAEYDDTFKLEDIEMLVKGNEQIVFEAMDEDPAGADLLAKTQPIPYSTFVGSTDQQSTKIEIFDKKDKKAGDIIV